MSGPGDSLAVLLVSVLGAEFVPAAHIVSGNELLVRRDQQRLNAEFLSAMGVSEAYGNNFMARGYSAGYQDHDVADTVDFRRGRGRAPRRPGFFGNYEEPPSGSTGPSTTPVRVEGVLGRLAASPICGLAVNATI